MNKFILVMLYLLALIFSGCRENTAKDKNVLRELNSKTTDQKPLVTFIELGSVNCIPCRMMQPVMESVKQKYGQQIEVIFYDVWKPEQRHYAQVYGISVIPTQVFLNRDGKEVLRHEGYYPEQELDKFLQVQGLKPVKKR